MELCCGDHYTEKCCICHQRNRWCFLMSPHEILRCGLKFTITCPPGRVPRLRYASLVASERKLRMTDGGRNRWCFLLSLHEILRCAQDDRWWAGWQMVGGMTDGWLD